MNKKAVARIRAAYLAKDLAIADLDSKVWAKAEFITVDKYWSGETAPAGRRFTAQLLWSDAAFYVRFEAEQTETLIVSEQPDRSKKTIGLWDRDVCEIFIAPDRKASNRYFEFEIAPTGEWIDLGIEYTPSERNIDWEYKSGMTSAASIAGEKVIMAVKIPFAAFGKTPMAGDVWLGNLFRCVGKDPTRGYLAWRPTKTSKPSFHVPSKFGEFEFVRAK